MHDATYRYPCITSISCFMYSTYHVPCTMYSSCTYVTSHILYTISSHFLHAGTYFPHTVFKHHVPIPYNTRTSHTTLYPFTSLCIYIHTSFTILISIYLITCPCTNIHHLFQYIYTYIHISHILSRITHINVFHAI